MKLLSITILGIIILGMLAIAFVPDVKADYDLKVQYPTAQDSVVVSYQSVPPHGGYKYFEQPDSWAIKAPVYDYASCSFYYNHTAWLMTWGFTIENAWSGTIPPNDPLNITIESATILLRVGAGPVNEGYFSFCYDYPNTEKPPVTLAKQYGNWTDSPLYPYYEGSSLHPSTLTWSITGYEPWEISDFLSNYSFRIMWTFTNNQTVQTFDCLGIEYYYSYPETIPDTPLTMPFKFSFTSLMWLLMIYFPAIAIVQYVPKIGFAFGIVLMLLVITAAQPNFFPIAMLGFTSVAVLLYKEWE